LEKGKSKFEDHQNKKLFTDQPKMKEMLRTKIEKKKKLNMKKINTIKVKRVKN
jgi:hypothetical protein